MTTMIVILVIKMLTSLLMMMMMMTSPSCYIDAWLISPSLTQQHRPYTISSLWQQQQHGRDNYYSGIGSNKHLLDNRKSIFSSPTTTTTTSSSRLDATKRGGGGGSGSSSSGKSKGKNNGSSGSTTTSTTNNNTNKIQVKLLKHVSGTGQAGDVVMVNQAYFNNKLRVQHLARRVTDDEIESEQSQKAILAAQELDRANQLYKLWGGRSTNGRRNKEDDEDGDDDDSSSSSSPFVLTVGGNKTGPDGKKLFGAIGPKRLLQELVQVTSNIDPSLADYAEHSKHIKITQIVPSESSSDDVVGSSSSSSSRTTPSSSSSPPSSSSHGGGGDTIKQTGRYMMTVTLLRRPRRTSGSSRAGNTNNTEEHIFVNIPVVVKAAA